MQDAQLNVMSPTFLSVGANNVKLGDIKLNVAESGNTILQFFNENGACAKVTKEMIGEEAFGTYPTSDAVFVYIRPDDASEWGCASGWFLSDDWDDTLYPMNDVILKKGQGFVLGAYDAGMSVTYSGAVDPGEEGEISLPYNDAELNVMGNVTPVNITLGDIVLNVAESGNTILQFFNENGACAKVSKEMIGEEAFGTYPTSDAVFVYIRPDDASEWGCASGWFLSDDWDDTLYPMNNISLPAGKGFVLGAYDAGMTIVIPSPLKPTVK